MKYWQPFGISDPQAPYINGDPTIGRAGSIPPAGAFEQPQRELVNMIQNANINPSDTDVSQLFKAVRSQYINYAVGDPSTNENTITVNFNPPIGTPTNGLPLRIKAAKTNTDVCHVVVDGVSSPLRRADTSELVANDLRAATIFECVWNDTFWAMTNYRGLGGTGGSTSNTYITKIPYAVDSSTTVNTIVASYAPAITTLAPGDAIEVKLKNTVTGAATINVNTLPAHAVVRADGSPLHANDAVVGQIMLLIYTDANNFQFSGIIPPPTTQGLGVPIGGLILTLGSTAIAGTVKANGAILQRSTHPGLWAFANASGRIVDDASWASNSARLWTSFSTGDGTTTFRVPELRGEFLRMYDDGRGADSGRAYINQQIDAVGTITMSGNVEILHPRVWQEYLGVWYPGGVGGPSPGYPGGIGFAPIGYNGEQVTALAWNGDEGGYGPWKMTGVMSLTASGGGSETRPRNAPVIPCIVDG